MKLILTEYSVQQLCNEAGKYNGCTICLPGKPPDITALLWCLCQLRKWNRAQQYTGHQSWRPEMPHRLHFERHQVTWAITLLLYPTVEAQPNRPRLNHNHSPEPREWCPHRRRQQCRGHRSFGTDRRRFASMVANMSSSFLVRQNCRTWLQSLNYFPVLTSLVLQTVDRVIPQAFPGTAFHGRSPV